MYKPLIKERIIAIDTKNSHFNDESVLDVHPSKIDFLTRMEKYSFDRGLIINTKVEQLLSLTFFNLSRVIKPLGELEVIVEQPISVMQQLDASEIEANAKLAGFTNITTTDYEFFFKEGNKDLKISSLKISMLRPELESEVNEKTTNKKSGVEIKIVKR